MSVSAKSRSIPHPPQAPAPQNPTRPVRNATEIASVPPKPVYRGDVYGLMIWFGGAIILALLHIVDAIYWWLQR